MIVHLVASLLIVLACLAFPCGMAVLLCLADDRPAEGALIQRRRS